MSKYIAAIDQGTTGTRCILFDHSGHPVIWAYEEHEQIYPQPGWVEHDPLEIWDKTQKVVRQALTQGNVPSGEIAAIGITNQRETAIVWDRTTGQPLYNAVVWQDTRTKRICDALAAESDLGQDRFRAKVGCRWRPTSPAPKSSGCWITCPPCARPPRPATRSSARRIRGSSGGSPAAPRAAPTSPT